MMDYCPPLFPSEYLLSPPLPPPTMSAPYQYHYQPLPPPSYHYQLPPPSYHYQSIPSPLPPPIQSVYYCSHVHHHPDAFQQFGRLPQMPTTAASADTAAMNDNLIPMVVQRKTTSAAEIQASQHAMATQHEVIAASMAQISAQMQRFLVQNTQPQSTLQRKLPVAASSSSFAVPPPRYANNMVEVHDSHSKKHLQPRRMNWKKRKMKVLEFSTKLCRSILAELSSVKSTHCGGFKEVRNFRLCMELLSTHGKLLENAHTTFDEILDPKSEAKFGVKMKAFSVEVSGSVFKRRVTVFEGEKDLKADLITEEVNAPQLFDEMLSSNSASHPILVRSMQPVIVTKSMASGQVPSTPPLLGCDGYLNIFTRFSDQVEGLNCITEVFDPGILHHIASLSECIDQVMLWFKRVTYCDARTPIRICLRVLTDECMEVGMLQLLHHYTHIALVGHCNSLDFPHNLLCYELLPNGSLETWCSILMSIAPGELPLVIEDNWSSVINLLENVVSDIVLNLLGNNVVGDVLDMELVVSLVGLDECQFEQRMTRAAANLKCPSQIVDRWSDELQENQLIDGEHNSCNVRTPVTGARKHVDPMIAKTPTCEVLSGVLSAAVDPLYPVTQKSSHKSVNDFVSVFRDSVLDNGCKSELSKKHRGLGKRKKSESGDLVKDNQIAAKEGDHGNSGCKKNQVLESSLLSMLDNSILCTHPSQFIVVPSVKRDKVEPSMCYRASMVTFHQPLSVSQFVSKMIYIAYYCLLQYKCYMTGTNSPLITCVQITEAWTRNLSNHLMLALIKALPSHLMQLWLSIMSAISDTEAHLPYLLKCEIFHKVAQNFLEEVLHVHALHAGSRNIVCVVMRIASMNEITPDNETNIDFFTSQLEVGWVCEQLITSREIALPLHDQLSFKGKQTHVFQSLRELAEYTDLYSTITCAIQEDLISLLGSGVAFLKFSARKEGAELSSLIEVPEFYLWTGFDIVLALEDLPVSIQTFILTMQDLHQLSAIVELKKHMCAHASVMVCFISPPVTSPFQYPWMRITAVYYEIQLPGGTVPGNFIEMVGADLADYFTTLIIFGQLVMYKQENVAWCMELASLADQGVDVTSSGKIHMQFKGNKRCDEEWCSTAADQYKDCNFNTKLEDKLVSKEGVL